jgi:hypothetical protein
MIGGIGTGAHTTEAYRLRQSIKKVGFDEIRSAMIRLGGDQAAPFLGLDKAIDLFASKHIPNGYG